MIGSGQGGRSSRPRSIVPVAWRRQLRRLDQQCTAAEKLLRFQRLCGYDSIVAERMYQRADMQRMLLRNKIKQFGNKRPKESS